jgi:hypothetical protein
MHATRRKFPIYPVAIAITLAIADHAHAQLCPLRAELDDKSKITTQAGLAFSPPAVLALDRSEPPFFAFGSPQYALPTPSTFLFGTASNGLALARLSNALPGAIFTRDEVISPGQAPGETIRHLLLQGSQPLLAETNLLPAFAE